MHSPFVFELVTQCFYDRAPKPEYARLEQYRNQLLQSKEIIKVTDFGAGSRVFRSNRRPVSKIARTAGITPRRAELLFRLTRYFRPESILEIGTSLGLATSALAAGNPKATITTLEGCPETARVARAQFEKFELSNIQSEITEFNSYLEKYTSANPETEPQNLKTDRYQLIYFDGHHSKEATLSYFELLLPTITNETVWIFDDIHWSKSMEEAWESIKSHPNVKVTIDTFQWGLVFFRREQVKEHFVIRI